MIIKKILFSFMLVTIVVTAIFISAILFVPSVEAGTGDRVSLSSLPIIPGSDFQVSGTGSVRQPKIAASNSYAAVVYQQSDIIYIRSATDTAGWMSSSLISSNGRVPDLVFQGENIVHVVWQNAQGTKIEYSACTLAVDTAPVCSSPFTIRTGNNLSVPSIVIDTATNLLHAAWIQDSNIETAISSNWAATTTIVATSPDKVALALSNSTVHLAFVDNNGAFLEYYNTSVSNHVWILRKSYSAGGDITGIWGYKKIDNPALATNNSDVYIVWDNLTSDNIIGDTNMTYGLTFASSGDSGNSWPVFGLHITSTNPTNNAPIVADGDKKLSRSTGVPLEINGLRPSLAFYNSDLFAVWQQRPANPTDCGIRQTDNGTSEIYYSYTHTTWLDTSMLANDKTNYSFDPSIAISPNGAKHTVFVRGAVNNECDLADQTKLAVYYRGPFQSPPDLDITKVAPTIIQAGDEITYTLIAINRGNQAANNVTITDTIPAGASYIRGGTRNGNIISWNINSLAGQGGVELVNFVVTATNDIVNSDYRISTTNMNTGGILTVTTVVTTNPVSGPSSFTLRKVASASVNLGDDILYTLILINSGQVPITNITVTDVVPTGADYVSGGTLTGNTVSWNISSLAAGEVVNLTFTVRPQSADTVILNTQYGATADGGLAADIGNNGTVRTDVPKTGIYLPIILK